MLHFGGVNGCFQEQYTFLFEKEFEVEVDVNSPRDGKIGLRTRLYSFRFNS